MGHWLRDVADSRAVAAELYVRHGFNVVALHNETPFMYGGRVVCYGPGLPPPWDDNPLLAKKSVWAVFPHANVALVVSERYAVLDIDGVQRAALERAHGALPTTTCAAVDGRRQLWFAVPPGRSACVDELVGGVRLLTRNAWVMAPPSITRSMGHRWRWQNVSGCTSAPEWMLEQMEVTQ